MKNFINILKTITIVGSLIAFSGCASTKVKKEENKTEINVACTEISEVSLKAAEPEMTKRGYKMNLIIVDSNVSVLKSANDGSVDAAMAVHLPFLEKFDKENNGDLVMMQPYTYYTGIGLYSDKYTKIEELPDNARIAIMNDSMNMDKGLRMLQDANLIVLNDKTNETYTILDIKENPKNLEIIEMEQAQTVRSLEDLDGAIVFFTHMKNAGKDFNSYLVRDLDADKYPIGIVVKAANENTQWAKDLAESLKSDEATKTINEYFGGVFTPYEK